jgi:predicted amidophosphoribosyltransferase
MQVNIQRVNGNWNLGYSLDKHTLQSTYIGDNQWGHPEFDTTRSEVGEALYQLKFRADFSQVSLLAKQISDSLSAYFSSSNLIIPMPPSKQRTRQPVIELARLVANNMAIPCYENLLVKTSITPQMKDIENRDEKIDTLSRAFTVYDVLGNGLYDVLIIDDLYDSGSSLEAATKVLRTYNKIRNVYVATLTRKRNE